MLSKNGARNKTSKSSARGISFLKTNNEKSVTGFGTEIKMVKLAHI
jgi:hypothetical protein